MSGFEGLRSNLAILGFIAIVSFESHQQFNSLEQMLCNTVLAGLLALILYTATSLLGLLEAYLCDLQALSEIKRLLVSHLFLIVAICPLILEFAGKSALDLRQVCLLIATLLLSLLMWQYVAFLNRAYAFD